MRLLTPFAVLGLLFCLVVDLPAQSVRVVFVSGSASIQRPEEPALRPAIKGETVIIGTRIVTGTDGRLVLTPMPGIKSIVTPNTTLLLEGASEERTSDTNVTQKVVLDLKEGSVVSDLQSPRASPTTTASAPPAAWPVRAAPPTPSASTRPAFRPSSSPTVLFRSTSATAVR